MPEAIISNAITNPMPGSIVTVKIDDYVCLLTIEKNKYGDDLPIIPTESRTEKNKVLYQLKLLAKLTQHKAGTPVSGHSFSLKSNRSCDRVESKGRTNTQGEMTFVLFTREPGEIELTVPTAGITMPSFKIKLQEAWYESLFLITGYHVCEESDFSGELVEGQGLDEKHKDDFLYGAAGIAMQGTGKASDGRYIRLDNKPGIWHKNKKGNPDRLDNPSAAKFSYTDKFYGKYGIVKENHSIAIDNSVIPKKSKVSIEGLGERVADDSGGGIRLYHIDNFLGSGATVVKDWLKSGINHTQRAVKYLGVA